MPEMRVVIAMIRRSLPGSFIGLAEPTNQLAGATHQLRPLVRSYLAASVLLTAKCGGCLRQSMIRRLPRTRSWCCGATMDITSGKRRYRERTRCGPSQRECHWFLRDPELHRVPVVTSRRSCLTSIQPCQTLAKLPEPKATEGLSLMPQIKHPETDRQRPAICTHNAGNHSVCDRRWRYIRYADGSEELYDRRKIPMNSRICCTVALLPPPIV